MDFKIGDKTRFAVIYQDVTKKAASIAKYTGISDRTIYSLATYFWKILLVIQLTSPVRILVSQGYLESLLAAF